MPPPWLVLPVSKGTMAPRMFARPTLRAKNAVNQMAVKPGEVQSTIGNWNGVTRTFTPLAGTQTHTPNAIRVLGRRDGIAFYFAPVIDVDSTTVGRAATAVGGGGICAGVWGLEGIMADGDLVTDSYLSQLGGYGPGNMRPNGDICSCSDIIFNGGVQIRGDAMYGQGHQLIPYGSSFSVLGLIGPHNLDVKAPVIDMNAIAVNNDNYLIPLTACKRSAFTGSGPNLYVTGNDSLTLPRGPFLPDLRAAGWPSHYHGDRTHRDLPQWTGGVHRRRHHQCLERSKKTWSSTRRAISSRCRVAPHSTEASWRPGRTS